MFGSKPALFSCDEAETCKGRAKRVSGVPGDGISQCREKTIQFSLKMDSYYPLLDNVSGGSLSIWQRRDHHRLGAM
jgi:hypothetical protein